VRESGPGKKQNKKRSQKRILLDTVNGQSRATVKATKPLGNRLDADGIQGKEGDHADPLLIQVLDAIFCGFWGVNNDCVHTRDRNGNEESRERR